MVSALTSPSPLVSLLPMLKNLLSLIALKALVRDCDLLSSGWVLGVGCSSTGGWPSAWVGAGPEVGSGSGSCSMAGAADGLWTVAETGAGGETGAGTATGAGTMTGAGAKTGAENGSWAENGSSAENGSWVENGSWAENGSWVENGSWAENGSATGTEIGYVSVTGAGAGGEIGAGADTGAFSGEMGLGRDIALAGD